MIFPRTIRGQLLLLALAVGVPLALLDAYDLVRERRAGRELAAESVHRLAVTTAAALDGDVLWANLHLEALARRPEVRAFDATRCDSIFKMFLALHPRYANLALLDTAGNVVCAPFSRVGRSEAPDSLLSWLHSQPLLRGQSQAGEWVPLLTPLTAGSRVSFLLVPVRDGQSRTRGWLEISLDLRRHQRELISSALSAGGEVLVLDDSTRDRVGTLSRKARIGETPVSDVRTGDTNHGWLLARGVDGVRRIYGFGRGRVTGWTVCVGIPLSAVDASVWRDPWHGALLLVATLLLAIALLLAIRGRIERPIRLVAEAVREVARGRTGTRLPLTGTVELAQLAREFNASLDARAQADQELRRREHLAAVGSMVAAVAHEVRNPLFGITANLDAFEARHGAREEFRGFLEVVRGEVDRLVGLMEGLLEYGRAARIAPTRSSPREIVAEAARSCLTQADAAGIEVENRVAAELPQIVVDRAQLVRVFHNLMDNAIHHAPAGGRVRVEAGVEQAGEGRWMTMQVADDGPGFRPEDLEHVFEPFFLRRAEGSGLGMPIVSRIVECHGGTVAAANRPEGGAVVTVRLPID